MIAGIAVLTLLAMHFSWEVSRLEERSRAMAEELALLRARVEGEGASEPTGPDPATDDGETVNSRRESEAGDAGELGN